MTKKILKIILIPIIALSPMLFRNCNSDPSSTMPKYSVLMAESDIKRNPEAWMLDFSSQPKWGYCHGLVCKAMLDLYDTYGDEKYYNYVEEYTDTMITSQGTIVGYQLEKYNIDRINSGKLLFRIYNKEQKEKYLEALQLLRSQLESHPRTSEGGFWHKKVYPSQMWLDGLYMGTPFYAEYSAVFNDNDGFDDVANQILLVRKHLYDSATGLYRHGWDESRQQKWADPLTGQSPNVWGRGVGWYAMAIADVLDYMPKENQAYSEVLSVFTDLSQTLVNYQDEETGVWYQVMDLPDSTGNYLESTASTMFAYVLLKGIRNGYLDESFKAPAFKAYNGIIKEFIRTNEDSTISITNCCAGAGLGGNPYRSGTFDYYINEHIRDNDPKAVGPFIMASIEYEKMTKK